MEFLSLFQKFNIFDILFILASLISLFLAIKNGFIKSILNLFKWLLIIYVIKNSFIHGLNPKEFWFHAITGREGVTDTAMKTAQSGYVQRRMVKVGEDIKVANDMTVRRADGRIVQFQYGGDNLDPVNTTVKHEKKFICDVDRLVDKLNTSFEISNE